jgi:hypothetical protein
VLPFVQLQDHTPTTPGDNRAVARALRPEVPVQGDLFADMFGGLPAQGAIAAPVAAAAPLPLAQPVQPALIGP